MRILHCKEQPVKLKVGGDGNLKSYYQALAEELGVLENIEFTGFLPEESLVGFYNSLDAFVLPSIDQRFEGFGLVASEALACGRPVVTTTAAGIAPIISGNSCGFVVAPRDPDALASAIQQLLFDTATKQKMVKSSRVVAERLSWDQVAGEYEGLYSEVISRGK
jgi:glycosyltransferase involved in cell wall biosynthesis